MIQWFLTAISKVIIYVMKPFKIYAYRTGSGFLKRLILELSTPVDFVLLWMNVQNETMLLHAEAYGGNYVFGKSVMITDHATASAEMGLPSVRANHFMGVNIVGSASDVFATNCPMINMGEPIRTLARQYLDREIIPPQVRDMDYDTVRSQCASILSDWSADAKMADQLVMRSAVTRVILQLIAKTTITKNDSESVTWAYMRRFGELSAFGRYLPFINGLLGSKKNIRKDAYFKLREYGIDNMAIDATLFAAMFSLGTLIIRCVSDIERHGVDYQVLDGADRARFIREAIRLYPTVTTTHRIVETPREVRVAGKVLNLIPGDEIAYSIICANRDPAVFSAPTEMKLDRPCAETDAVLSWSTGPHDCPAKELSMVVTHVMLDAMCETWTLKDLKYRRSPV